MALRHASAYALRTFALGEADLIAQFFTLEYGAVRATARGARRLKSRFGSAFEPMTRSRLVLYFKEDSDLGRVSSCEVERSYFDALGTPEAAAGAAYWAELLMEFALDSDPAPKLFRLVGAALDGVEAGVSVDLTSRYFESWILRLSGFLPDLNRCGSCGCKLTDQRWVSDRSLEFVCAQECGGMTGRLLCSAEASDLLQAILRQPLLRVAAQRPRRSATQALAAVHRVLITGHVGRRLRSWRYLDQLSAVGSARGG